VFIRVQILYLRRIKEFKGTNFRQMARKLADIPWDFYIAPGVIPRLNMSSRQSRRSHME